MEETSSETGWFLLLYRDIMLLLSKVKNIQSFEEGEMSKVQILSFHTKKKQKNEEK